jgi:hypothetical protein
MASSQSKHQSPRIESSVSTKPALTYNKPYMSLRKARAKQAAEKQLTVEMLKK